MYYFAKYINHNRLILIIEKNMPKMTCTYYNFIFVCFSCNNSVLPTHQDITVGNFLETLTKFSKCQQRYGK